MIEVRNLVKDYGGHLAVDHLNFTIYDGQIYGFLGPNGAGKSTTMNIMTGYIGATEGDVLINGHNILEEPEEAKKCIGYLPELPPLYVDMTVEEQLIFAAELKKIPKKERTQAVSEVMELAKLTDVKGRLIRNLSKGYRQRVGLAQAVIGFPPVIVLDEPTVGLDPKQIIEIRDTIKELGKNHTVILSSHILSEVSAVCDHIMIIDKGKLIASDTPENLERQMAVASGMELLIKASREEVETTLNAISQVDTITVLESGEEGICKALVSFRSGEDEGEEDVRERIFFAFADKRLPILSMQSQKASLEDVFLELTKDGESARVKDLDEPENIQESISKNDDATESHTDAEQEEGEGDQSE
ncbi:ABC transporter ATP-binding protein [Lacrimispora sp.]|uniref:ABC transporter ATP-binding protein n=1 Tax=Lacrimispora sp. TaxID=2719234 RepID=UPI0028A9D323|nr:ABC transporter ATP-binding protein [Lacrimispora sp.]